MTIMISRRQLLARTGGVLAGSAAAQMLAAVAMAQDAASPQSSGLSMTMLFMNDAKAKFDSGKYVSKHLPLLRSVYDDTVERIELRTAASSAMGMPPAMLATSTLWIRDVQAFSQKLAANAERINKDLDSIARGNRMVQVDRVALQMGEARSDVAANSSVFSMFYPATAPSFGPGAGGRGRGGPAAGPPAPAGGAEGANEGESGGAARPSGPRFDPGYFVQTYMPNVYSLWGNDVLRRVEATLGMDQGGQKAAHLGAYHLMIRDRVAYDTKARTVFGELQKDSGKFTNVFPMLADLRVTAIG